MSSLTRWVLAHKRIVVVFWIVLTIAGIMAAGPATKALDQKFSVPNKEGWETNVAIARDTTTPAATALRCSRWSPSPGQDGRQPGSTRASWHAVDARLERALPNARIASYASTGDKTFVSNDGRTVFALVYPHAGPRLAVRRQPQGGEGRACRAPRRDRRRRAGPPDRLRRAAATERRQRRPGGPARGRWSAGSARSPCWRSCSPPSLRSCRSGWRSSRS